MTDGGKGRSSSSRIPGEQEPVLPALEHINSAAAGYQITHSVVGNSDQPVGHFD